MLQDNSVRTIWAISTICCPPIMDSTSSLVIFIISTQKKSLKWTTILQNKNFPNSLKHLALEVLSIPGPQTGMIQQKCRGGEKLASKKLRTQDRLPQYGWKPVMRNLFQLPKILSSGSMNLENHFSCGSTRPICTCLRIPNPQARVKLVAGSLPTMIR